MFSPESTIFLWIKPKKKKNCFVESLDQCRRLEEREKARNAFCDEPTSVWPRGVTQHRISINFVFDFARIFSLFSLIFRTSKFWSLMNLIKQLFHSRLLDMRLVIQCSNLPINFSSVPTLCLWCKPKHWFPWSQNHPKRSYILVHTCIWHSSKSGNNPFSNK